eukprot:TRINITY_DN13550_c1_g2_i3.p1 TRINITY_DN13550_c1_g2~~TRINITY_DN13550_c1_g2_i3.p1  ORF type:complete len:774 (+),score=137.00 TRINITY_DN13550_c1_g2_i3:60-2324(+)
MLPQGVRRCHAVVAALFLLGTAALAVLRIRAWAASRRAARRAPRLQARGCWWCQPLSGGPGGGGGGGAVVETADQSLRAMLERGESEGAGAVAEAADESLRRMFERGGSYDSRAASRIREACPNATACDHRHAAEAAAAEQLCHIRMSLNLTGEDMSVVPISGMRHGECCERCLETPGCAFWAMVPALRTCHLKRHPGRPEEKHGVWGGSVGRRAEQTLTELRRLYAGGVRDPDAGRLINESCSPRQVLADVIFSAPDINTIDPPVASNRECCARCAAAVGCVAWEHTPDGRCWLKGHVHHVTPQNLGLSLGAGVMRGTAHGAPFHPQLDDRFRKVTSEDVAALLAPPPADEAEPVHPQQAAAPAWEHCPGRVDVSFVLATRNERCADPEDASRCQLARLQRSLDTLARFDWAAQEVVCEVIVVSWNEVPGEPGVPQLAPPPGKRYCAIRYVAVSHEQHLSVLPRDNLVVSETLAKNAGVRRANGRWVSVTNPDILWPQALLRSIAHDVRNRSGTVLTLQTERVGLDQWGGLNHWVPKRAGRYNNRGECAVVPGAPERFTARQSVPGDPAQPNLVCDGCPGDFTLAPCEAWENARGHAECGHTRALDHEVLCWMERLHRLPGSGRSYPRHSYRVGIELGSALVAQPPGCAVYHQHHYRFGSKAPAQQPVINVSRWRPCFGENRTWWDTRSDFSFNATARPECWGVCAELLQEEQWPPNMGAARQQWAQRMAAPYPALERAEAERRRGLFAWDVP